MDYQSWIKVPTPLHKKVITTEQITQFSQGFPEAFRPAPLSIPLTFPMIWWQQTNLPWLDLPETILIHGQQSLRYEHELKYDVALFYQIELVNVREANGGSGRMTLLDCTMKVSTILKQHILVADTTLLLLAPPEPQSSYLELEPGCPQYPFQIYYQWEGRYRPSPGDLVFDACLGTITGSMLVDYAVASGDNNAIHVDIIKAREAGAPLRIAQGLLIGGMIGNRLQLLNSDDWLLCELNYRFRAPVMEADVVRVLVKVVETDHLTQLECSISVYVELRAGFPSNLLVYEGSARYMTR